MNIGDIFLCSGNGSLSRLIKRYNRVVMKMTGPAAEISHVAMAGPSGDEVFEATTLNKWCGQRGVQINPCRDWKKNYDGRIWVRRCKINLLSSVQLKQIRGKMKQLVGRPYEHGIPGLLELALAALEIPGLSAWWARRLRTNTSLHCSEADAEVLLNAGMLYGLRPNKLPPCLWWDNIAQLDTFYGKPEVIK